MCTRDGAALQPAGDDERPLERTASIAPSGTVDLTGGDLGEAEISSRAPAGSKRGKAPEEPPPPKPKGEGRGASQNPEDRVGSTVGSYRLVDVIGRGGMGAVYRAEHIRLPGREVALKLLRADYAQKADSVGRFIREAQSVYRIQHRNIVGVHDIVEMEGGPTFIVMELLRGESLGKLLRRPGALAPARSLDILIQTCDGLAAAHDHQIIHRDLKPDNIFVSRGDDGRDLIKLLDFGVAKLLAKQEGDVGVHTQAGAVIGTPAFMSPEQAGGMTISARSDIYSLGAIMYEIFTGSPLFRGKSFGEFVRKHLNEPPVPPRQTEGGAQTDPRIEELILRALEKDPAKRFPGAVELRDALQEIYADLVGGAGAAHGGSVHAAAPAPEAGGGAALSAGPAPAPSPAASPAPGPAPGPVAASAPDPVASPEPLPAPPAGTPQDAHHHSGEHYPHQSGQFPHGASGEHYPHQSGQFPHGASGEHYPHQSGQFLHGASGEHYARQSAEHYAYQSGDFYRSPSAEHYAYQSGDFYRSPSAEHSAPLPTPPPETPAPYAPAPGDYGGGGAGYPPGYPPTPPQSGPLYAQSPQPPYGHAPHPGQPYAVGEAGVAPPSGQHPALPSGQHPAVQTATRPAPRRLSWRKTIFLMLGGGAVIGAVAGLLVSGILVGDSNGASEASGVSVSDDAPGVTPPSPARDSEGEIITIRIASDPEDAEVVVPRTDEPICHTPCEFHPGEQGPRVRQYLVDKDGYRSTIETVDLDDIQSQYIVTLEPAGG